MTTILKDWQEEQDADFIFRFTGNRSDIDLIPFQAKEVQSYIHAREKSLLARLREEVEKMKLPLEIEYDKEEKVLAKRLGISTDTPEQIKILRGGYNQALSHIGNMLKTL